jgi:hypothetical protein
VVTDELGADWIAFRADDPAEDRPHWPRQLQAALLGWIERQAPAVRVRCVLPITESGSAVALHVWFDRV